MLKLASKDAFTLDRLELLLEFGICSTESRRVSPFSRKVSIELRDRRGVHTKAEAGTVDEREFA